jgi:hypothetical protein
VRPQDCREVQVADPEIERTAGHGTEPDITRTEHIRRRGHAHPARRQRRSFIASMPTGERMVTVWQSLIAVLGFAYLTEVTRFALRYSLRSACERELSRTAGAIPLVSAARVVATRVTARQPLLETKFVSLADNPT